MADVIEMIVRERIDLDTDYSKLSPSMIGEIVKTISERIRIDLIHANWDGMWITPTEALAADQITISSIGLLRSSILSEKPPEGNFSIELRKLREEEKRIASDHLQEKDEATPVPNWPIPCSKCKLKMIYTWTAQTRSSDEPSTVYYKCLNCGSERRGS
jgi:DNA-directed RNA polymerase subunit M/transcription elongation factor TFIIS